MSMVALLGSSNNIVILLNFISLLVLLSLKLFLAGVIELTIVIIMVYQSAVVVLFLVNGLFLSNMMWLPGEGSVIHFYPCDRLTPHYMSSPGTFQRLFFIDYGIVILGMYFNLVDVGAHMSVARVLSTLGLVQTHVEVGDQVKLIQVDTRLPYGPADSGLFQYLPKDDYVGLAVTHWGLSNKCKTILGISLAVLIGMALASSGVIIPAPVLEPPVLAFLAFLVYSVILLLAIQFRVARSLLYLLSCLVLSRLKLLLACVIELTIQCIMVYQAVVVARVLAENGFLSDMFPLPLVKFTGECSTESAELEHCNFNFRLLSSKITSSDFSKEDLTNYYNHYMVKALGFDSVEEWQADSLKMHDSWYDN